MTGITKTGMCYCLQGRTLITILGGGGWGGEGNTFFYINIFVTILATIFFIIFFLI